MSHLSLNIRCWQGRASHKTRKGSTSASRRKSRSPIHQNSPKGQTRRSFRELRKAFTRPEGSLPTRSTNCCSIRKSLNCFRAVLENLSTKLKRFPILRELLLRSSALLATLDYKNFQSISRFLGKFAFPEVLRLVQACDDFNLLSLD